MHLLKMMGWSIGVMKKMGEGANMRKWAIWAFTGTLLSGVVASATAGTQKDIPEVFRGVWYQRDPSECNDIYALTIDARSVAQGESDAIVRDVRVRTSHRIEVLVDRYGEITADTPPGDDAYAGRARVTYVLSQDGQQLTVKTKRATFSVTRCPVQ